MLLSLFAYSVLVSLLVISNWDYIILLLSWSYSLASRWVTTSTILVVYGLVLIYLLLVVHGLAIPQENPRKRRKSTLVPYYDENGQLQGWVKEEWETTNSNVPHATLGEHLSLPPLPSGTIAPPPPQTIEALPNFPLTSWDGFPDHRFRSHFTRQQVEDTSRLAFYWISDKLPGKRGSQDAVTPEKGKQSRFKCAGIIQCKAAVCTVRIAPGTNIARQIEALCTCGSPLRHRPCKVEWSVVFYRDGAIFENSGAHNHSKYTHSLPVSKKRTLQLQEFISRQPIVLRGSQTNVNHMSQSDNSQIGEDEHNTHGNMNIVDSDEEDDDSHNHESGKKGYEMNSEDERMLDPEADEDEDEE
ncbi:hypothetical protein C8J57DRAFT_1730462 [Mycena rebaudengoi]|nr:hypothetical protein C8J57DRAFT_1730462 [Mycena rebaudengoi]